MENIKKRDTNIELLRIVAMLMVTMIHCVDNGLIINNTPNLSIFNYVLIHFVRAFVGIANGLFILITGYYQINSRFKLKKILGLWGKTLFYSWLVLFILKVMHYPTKTLFSIFPITTGAYWFISAYIALYFLTPILNIFLNKLNKNQFKFLLVLIVTMFSFFKIILITETFSGLFMTVIMFYMIGAYIRRFVEIKYNQKYFIKYLLVTIIFTCVNLIVAALSKVRLNTTFHSIISTIYGRFMDFGNILLVLMTVLLFLKFRTIEIKSSKINKIITFLAPSMLSIYIIQQNTNYSSLWRYDGVTNYGNSFLMVPYMFFIVIIVFLVCLFIDLLRRGLYSLIKKTKIVSRLIKWLDAKTYSLSEKINNYVA